MGRNGALVHISPRGIENRLNEHFVESMDDEQDEGPGGKGSRQNNNLADGLSAWQRMEGGSSEGPAREQAAQGTRSVPSEPAATTISPTRAEAIVAAAAAVDAAALVLRQQQAQPSTPRSRTADALLLAQKREEHVLYQQKQQQLATFSRSTSDRSLELTATYPASMGEGQDKEGEAGSEMSSATQRIHDAFLILSSKDSPFGPGDAMCDAELTDTSKARARKVKNEADSCGIDTTNHGGRDSCGTRAGSADIAGQQGQHLTFKEFQAQVEKQTLAARVSELESSLKMSAAKAQEYEMVAAEREQRINEAETRISELHAILGELEAGHELDKQQHKREGKDAMDDFNREKEELEAEILVARRIATFRAVRIAVLQQQLQEQKEASERQAQKIDTLQEASRSLSAIKERDHERMQSSLQTASSKIARLQQENRRLQRLLQSRLDLDPGDTASAGRSRSIQQSSLTSTPTIPPLAQQAARDITRDSNDIGMQPVPPGAKPRVALDRSRDSSLSPRKTRVSLFADRQFTSTGGDIVLVKEEDIGGSAGGSFLLPASAAGRERAGSGAGTGDMTPGTGQNVIPDGVDTPGSVESMHWSSTSSDERLEDRISKRRAVSSKRKKQNAPPSSLGGVSSRLPCLFSLPLISCMSSYPKLCTGKLMLLIQGHSRFGEQQSVPHQAWFWSAVVEQRRCV